MLDIEKHVVASNFSCSVYTRAVSSPLGPFFTNSKQHPSLFWPSLDFNSALFSFYSIQLDINIMLSIGWEYFNGTNQYETGVLILRSATNYSVSLNTVQYQPFYSASFGINQLDLVKSLQNEFEVTNSSTVIEFPRGMIKNTKMATSLDGRYLIAGSVGGLIAFLDLSTSSPSLLSSSLLHSNFRFSSSPSNHSSSHSVQSNIHLCY